MGKTIKHQVHVLLAAEENRLFHASDSDTIVRVARTTSYADRLRAYRILLDGQEAARVSAGQSVDIPVFPGTNSIVVKLDWCGSPTPKFSLDVGDTVHLECGSNLRGLRIFCGSFTSSFSEINT